MERAYGENTWREHMERVYQEEPRTQRVI